MKIKTKNPNVLEHRKVNLPDIGTVEVAEDGTIEVSDELGAELCTSASDSWEPVDADLKAKLAELAAEASESESDNKTTADASKYVDHEVTELDIEVNPLLANFGISVGDTIGIPVEAFEANPNATSTVIETEEDEKDESDDEDNEDEKDAQDSEEEKEDDEENQEMTEDEVRIMRKDLLKKNLDQLQTMAVALEIPQSEFTDLKKADLVELLIKNAKDGE